MLLLLDPLSERDLFLRERRRLSLLDLVRCLLVLIGVLLRLDELFVFARLVLDLLVERDLFLRERHRLSLLDLDRRLVFLDCDGFLLEERFFIGDKLLLDLLPLVLLRDRDLISCEVWRWTLVDLERRFAPLGGV